MRTTITIEDDVAALLKQVQKRTHAKPKQIINEALREGLLHLAGPTRQKKTFRTGTVSLGACLLGSLDNISEVLSLAEGEKFK